MRARLFVFLASLSCAVAALADPPANFTPVGGGCSPNSSCVARTFRATAPSGSNAVTIKPGANINLNGGAPSGGNITYEPAQGLMQYRGTGHVFLGGGGDPDGEVRAGRYFSFAGNGVNALTFTNNGARLKLGTGANDHLSSDGSGIVAGTSITVGGSVFLSGGVVASIATTASNNQTANPFTFNDLEGVAWVGVPTASLALCNGTAPNTAGGTRGTIQYDTTTNSFRFCNGVAWTELASASTDDAVWSATYFGAIAETGALQGPLHAARDGNLGRIACSWASAGSGGTAGVTVRVFNVTAAASLGTFTLGACNSAAGSALVANGSGALIAGNTYRIEIVSSGDCTAKPSNIVCNVNITQ